jgi:hypothetical protein
MSGDLILRGNGARLSKLNAIATLFEFEIDETATNMTIKVYDWK